MRHGRAGQKPETDDGQQEADRNGSLPLSRYTCALSKAVVLLEQLDGTVPIGLTELARRTGIPKTTAHRTLLVLAKHGLVVRDALGYRLGMRITMLARRAGAGLSWAVLDAIVPHLLALYEATPGGVVGLGVLHGFDVLYVLRYYRPSEASLASRLASHANAHCTALGKVLLAFEPAHMRTIAREPRLAAATPHTVTSIDALERELSAVRRTGAAFDHDEYVVGLASVAVSITNGTPRPIAGIAVTGPTSTFKPDRVEPQVRRAALAASRAALRLNRTGIVESGAVSG